MIISILGNGKIYISPNKRIASCVPLIAKRPPGKCMPLFYLAKHYMHRGKHVTTEQINSTSFSSGSASKGAVVLPTYVVVEDVVLPENFE